jgi:anti-sigma B factor antagonist
MQLTTETFGRTLVVHTPEELTAESISVFQQSVEEALESGHRQLVFELEHTDLLDSEALTMLLDIRDTLRDVGGDLKLCGLVDHGRKILEVTRLDLQFDIFDSVIDAVGSFK